MTLHYPSGWTDRVVGDCPQQINHTDCGVFAAQFAEAVSRNAPLTVQQDDIPRIRRKMCADILRCRLSVPADS